MSGGSAATPLHVFLSGVPRRYQLLPLPPFPCMQAPLPPGVATTAADDAPASDNISTFLALCIEQARLALHHGRLPDDGLKQQFLSALARLVSDAMQEEAGDPAVQALVLRHSSNAVREYAALAAQGAHHRRHVETVVNAIAHPGKLEHMPPSRLRDALAGLHAAAADSDWHLTGERARHLQADRELELDEGRREGVRRLADNDALGHLARMAALETDPAVQRYHTLREQNGPRSNSALAAEQGAASRQRGAEVEARSADALQSIADLLNQSESEGRPYRVVTSMRVPAAFPADPDGAKSEWDTVLLRRAGLERVPGRAPTPLWDVCLLAEAKASIDSVGTDLPRLIRGLRLLAQADPDSQYEFRSREGMLRLRGASLAALATDEHSLRQTVVYCCDVEHDAHPRLLSAAARMQLLSTPASLQYAAAFAKDGRPLPGPEALAPVWNDLLQEARWQGVLHQYPTLRLARELTVHVQDLIDAARAIKTSTNG